MTQKATQTAVAAAQTAAALTKVSTTKGVTKALTTTQQAASKVTAKPIAQAMPASQRNQNVHPVGAEAVRRDEPLVRGLQDAATLLIMPNGGADDTRSLMTQVDQRQRGQSVHAGGLPADGMQRSSAMFGQHSMPALDGYPNLSSLSSAGVTMLTCADQVACTRPPS